MSNPVSGKVFDFPILKRVFSYVLPYRKKFFVSVFLTIIIAFIAPLRPVMIQYTLDHFIAHPEPDKLLYITIAMIALLLLQSSLQYFQTYLTNWLGQAVIKDLRVKLFKHILDFKLKYFDHTPIGTIVTRVISDMETIADIFSEGLIVIIGDILQLIVVICVMFFFDWRITLVSLSTIPFLLIATNFFKNGIKKTFQDVRTQVARLNTFVQEHITGMSVVQVFGREDEEMKKFMAINELHKKAHIRSVWYYSIFFPVVEILSATSIGMMIWWGTKGVIAGHATFGTLVAFIMFINMLFRPIRELADKFNTLQMGMVSSERIFKVLDTKAVIENNGTKIPENIRGEIRFENVWFSYKEPATGTHSSNDADPEWVLKNINLSIEPGKTLALVGATGAGKSSIINILSRFYEISKGKITIDETDIRDYELHALRKNIAMVLQDVFLFSDTVENNISLKRKDISREQIIEAAKSVGADHFIERLPGAYDFNVQERGSTLSSGQRQLLAFIRAYVYDPKILILDEATSSIDAETEELIQAATEKLTQNRTSIIIAHRLATVQKADKIIVLDHGEIKESGNHQSLLKLNGIYKNLYEIQFQRNMA